LRTFRVDPDVARDDAAEILGGRRFRSDPAPRPLRGPLEWLGDRLRDLADAVGDTLRALPGPTWMALGAVALLLVALVVALLVRAHRRGGGSRLFAPGRGRAEPAARERPEELERQAAAAEAAGDLERALRLRFRAGLLRLDQRGAIRYRPSLTTGEVRRAIGSATFDDLARRFDEVAYGRDPAQPGDVDAARRDWPRVLEEAARR
jgi:hypothetical protein